MRILGLSILSLLLVTTISCQQPKEEAESKTDESTSTQVAETQPESQQAEVDKSILARVNGYAIYKEDLRGRPLEEAIEDQILYQEALSRGYEEKFQEDIQQYKMRKFITQLQNEIITDDLKENPVTNEEIEERYNKNKDNFTYIKTIEISTEDKTIAEDLKNKLKSVVDTESVKNQYSDKNVKIKELGLSNKLNQNFDELKVGNISEIQEKGSKYYLYKITEVRETPKQMVFRSIHTDIKRERQRKAIKEYVEQLKNSKSFDVEIVDRN